MPRNTEHLLEADQRLRYSAMQARRFFTSFRMTVHSINTSSRART